MDKNYEVLNDRHLELHFIFANEIFLSSLALLISAIYHVRSFVRVSTHEEPDKENAFVAQTQFFFSFCRYLIMLYATFIEGWET